MVGSLAERAELLKGMALFRELADAELEQIASRMHEYRLPANQLLYGQGDRPRNFYIVTSGLLLSQRMQEGRRTGENIVEPGDAFGSLALLSGSPREAAVSALKDTQLLYLLKQDFEWMRENYAPVAARLRLLSLSEKLKDELQFDWLERGESIHYVTRKHIGYLWSRWARSAGLAILGMLAFLMAVGASASAQFYWVVAGGLLLFAALALGIWEALNWLNAFYVVTNLRVVLLELILLRSSSRVEAPLANIQSVDMHSSLLSRLLGMGDLTVRTYTGTVNLRSVGDPIDTKYIIEDYANRLGKQDRQAKHESIRQAVRETLGLAPVGAPPPPPRRPRYLADDEGFSLFKTRTIEGDTITYHKHWFTLVNSLVLPAIVLLLAVFGVPRIFGGWPQGALGWIAAIAALAGSFGLGIYRILDWLNDIYVVTPESLLDIERKPLGSEIVKSAPLANVLSLENRKVGIFGLLLDFGAVRISVGEAALEFFNVANPVQVQQDIFARMEALKVKQGKAHAEDEKQRMSEWLQVYEQERGKIPSPPTPPSSPQAAHSGQASPADAGDGQNIK